MNVVDDFTRECLAVDVNYAFASAAVIRLLDSIRDERGTPATIRFDNGSEFTSRAMLQWGADQGVALHFIDPGKPTQNAQIESLNVESETNFLTPIRSQISSQSAASPKNGESTTTKSAHTPRSTTLTPREFAERHEPNACSSGYEKCRTVEFDRTGSLERVGEFLCAFNGLSFPVS